MATLVWEEELYPAMVVGMEASKLAREKRMTDEYMMKECMVAECSRIV